MVQPVINPETPLPSDTDTSDRVTVDGAVGDDVVSQRGRRRKSAAGNAARAVTSKWASLAAIVYCAGSLSVPCATCTARSSTPLARRA